MRKAYDRDELEKISSFLDKKGLMLERSPSKATWHIDLKKGDLKYGSGLLEFSWTYGWRATHTKYPQFQEYVNEALGNDQASYGETNPYMDRSK